MATTPDSLTIDVYTCGPDDLHCCANQYERWTCRREFSVATGSYSLKSVGSKPAEPVSLRTIQHSSVECDGEEFDAQYGLKFTPIPSVSNSAYNVNSPEGTNAQPGESNDPAATRATPVTAKMASQLLKPSEH